MNSLAGKTVIITEVFHGIGHTIALRCARDNANRAVLAKTAEPNSKVDLTANHSSCTGNFYTDEDLLCDHDLTDFVKCAINNNAKLFMDAFID